MLNLNKAINIQKMKFKPSQQTHTKLFYGSMDYVCPGQPRWASTRRNIHPLTPIVVINRPYLLSPPTMIHGILPIQFMRLAVFFHNLSKFCLPWSTSWPGQHRLKNCSHLCVHITVFNCHTQHNTEQFL